MRKTHRHQNSCCFLYQNQFNLNPRTPPVHKADQHLGLNEIPEELKIFQLLELLRMQSESAELMFSVGQAHRPGNSLLPHLYYSSKFLKSVRQNNSNSSPQSRAGSPGFTARELCWWFWSGSFPVWHLLGVCGCHTPIPRSSSQEMPHSVSPDKPLLKAATDALGV